MQTTIETVDTEIIIDHSPRGVVTKTDWRSVGRGLVITMSAAALTFIAPVLLNIHYSFTFYGHVIDLTAPVVAVLSVVINITRKFLTSKTTLISSTPL